MCKGQAGCSGRCAEVGIWEEGEPRRGAEADSCKGPQEAAEGSRGHARPQSLHLARGPCADVSGAGALSGRQQSGLTHSPRSLRAVICGSSFRWAAVP